MVKIHGGKAYLFTVYNSTTPRTIHLNVSSNGELIPVLFENRSINPDAEGFDDYFGEYGVHVYEVPQYFILNNPNKKDLYEVHDEIPVTVATGSTDSNAYVSFYVDNVLIGQDFSGDNGWGYNWIPDLPGIYLFRAETFFKDGSKGAGE